MPKGLHLWCDNSLSWGRGRSLLLLNSRLPEPLREKVLATEFPNLQDHAWLATSGTGGRMKLVALARSALEASARAVNAHLGATAADLWINPLPVFHVGGLGMRWRADLAGGRCVELAAWDAAEFVRLCEGSEGTLSSLVPAQVHDLVRSGMRAPASLRAVVVGGGALDAGLRERACGLGWPLLRSYGLTEAGSQVATAAMGGVESDWLPLLPHVQGRTSNQGVLELRGPSLLSGWMLFGGDGRAHWEDPKVDGWLRTSDRVELRGRALRVLGRVDDLVKIRGELVDAAALERALQERVLSGAVLVLTETDERTGFRLRVVAENQRALRQAEQASGEIFPAYARPQEFVVGVITRTALGKIVRSCLPGGESEGTSGR